ncbi:hypothetical protein, partial [Escherichia coli]|uniref:hypothetical protein n=1 Tax=Escherichia coli TaxID=562 RepID=UPI0015CA0847
RAEDQNTMRQITFDEVVSSWLKDEWHYDVYSDLRKDRRIRNLVLNPNLLCEDDNKERLRILSRDRKSIINKIPDDTAWYVTSLNSRLMSNLYLIHTDWCKNITHKTYKLKDTDYKELKKVDPVHLRRITAIRKSKKVQN